jgi:NAD/NADP transhydrogenase beta subunit
MDTQTLLVYFAKASYLLAAALFILGIKRMSSPVTARKGIVQAGIGMVIATLATFAITRGHNLGLIVAAIALGIVGYLMHSSPTGSLKVAKPPAEKAPAPDKRIDIRP